MLIHRVIANKAGEFSVAYITAGLFVPTVVCDCRMRHQAEEEAARRNAEQIARQGASPRRPLSSSFGD